jgi:5-methylcytosine-specific restriction endonuclease McrA
MSRTPKEWIGKNDDVAVPAHVRLRVLLRFDGHCQECGGKIDSKRWICDHRVALINGGENRENNLGPIHESCNKGKTAADVAEKSKVYRKAAKNAGIKLTRGPAIRSGGFQPRQAQCSASRPIRRRSEMEAAQ